MSEICSKIIIGSFYLYSATGTAFICAGPVLVVGAVAAAVFGAKKLHYQYKENRALQKDKKNFHEKKDIANERFRVIAAITSFLVICAIPVGGVYLGTLVADKIN